jgi:hypothetical protein
MTVSMLSPGLRSLRPCCASQACILAIEVRPSPAISESSRLVCSETISGRNRMRSEARRTTNDAYGAFVTSRMILSGRWVPEATAVFFALIM